MNTAIPVEPMGSAPSFINFYVMFSTLLNETFAY